MSADVFSFKTATDLEEPLLTVAKMRKDEHELIFKDAKDAHHLRFNQGILFFCRQRCPNPYRIHCLSCSKVKIM